MPLLPPTQEASSGLRPLLRDHSVDGRLLWVCPQRGRVQGLWHWEHSPAWEMPSALQTAARGCPGDMVPIAGNSRQERQARRKAGAPSPAARLSVLVPVTTASPARCSGCHVFAGVMCSGCHVFAGWRYPGEDPASRYHAIDLPLRDGANLTNNEFRISPASSINLLPDFSNMLSCHEREKKGASVSILENSIIHYLYALGCI